MRKLCCGAARGVMSMQRRSHARVRRHCGLTEEDGMQTGVWTRNMGSSKYCRQRQRMDGGGECRVGEPPGAI